MRLRIELHTYWLCGTGRGDGPGADELCAKTRDELPVVPGRTLKGILREQAEIVATPEEVEALFGSPILSDRGRRLRSLEAARFATRAGALRLDSAELGESTIARDHWRAWARTVEGKRDIAFLYTRLASTRVDHKAGTAQDKTLRTIEVAVPMTLFAPLELLLPPLGLTRSRAETIIDEAAGLVRELGSHRNRGLGRVTVRLEKQHD